jgi:HEPN domain-containing protein
MPDRDAAETMISAAERDLRALRNMLDSEAFASEVFGFHAQQVAEKSLKAWISLMGREYPKTHSIRLLIVILEQAGLDLPDLWELVELSAFAAQFRYEPFDMAEEPLNREEILQNVERLFDRVVKMLQEMEPGE